MKCGSALVYIITRVSLFTLFYTHLSTFGFIPSRWVQETNQCTLH